MIQPSFSSIETEMLNEGRSEGSDGDVRGDESAKGEQDAVRDIVASIMPRTLGAEEQGPRHGCQRRANRSPALVLCGRDSRLVPAALTSEIGRC